MPTRIQQFLSSRFTAPIWTILIFILMAIPGKMLPSERISYIPNLDKLVHATLFGGFVYLWSISYASRKTRKFNLNKYFTFFLIIACLYGIGTELMQKYFIPNRDYDIYDIAADISGAAIAYIIVLWKFNRKRRPDTR
jgi:VanZ family protein